MRTGDRFPCSLPKDEGAGSLYGVKTGVCPRIGLEGWLKWFAHHLGGIEGRVGCTVPCFCSCQHLVFAPGSLEVAIGLFWSFCIFCPFAPAVLAHTYF